MYLPRHQKTYLSRAMTRAMAIDHPIGDPHGGPAYGERNEPVSAIMAIGTMFASGSAIAATGLTLMAGLSFAGAALSLVGNLTGNSKLSKIGMVVGLVGGVGALAESAGMFGASAAESGAGATGLDFEGGTAALSQTPTAQVTPVAAPGGSVETFALPDAPSIVGTPPPAGGTMTDLAFTGQPGFAQDSLIGNALSGSAAPGSQVAPLGVDELAARAASPAQALPQTPAAIAPPTTNAPTAPTAPSAPSQYQLVGGDAPIAPGGTGLKVPGASSGAPTLGPSTAPGFVDSLKVGNYWDAAKAAGTNLMDLAKANPALAQVLSGAVSGGMDILSGKNAAYIDYLESRGDLDKAQAEKIRYEIAQAERRRAQLNRNYANMPAGPVWTPNFQVTPPPGLVADAMKA